MDYQTSLFADDTTDSVALAPERRRLTRGAWVDVQRSWLADPDAVFSALVEEVPWRAERREMYDSVVDVPRLVHTYLADAPLPHPALAHPDASGAQKAAAAVALDDEAVRLAVSRCT